MINVGIIGCGIVGMALKEWLEQSNPECKLFISDPYKGYNDDLSNIDIAFLQIHVPTEDDGTQDLTLMKELIASLPDVPAFVRTTILPGTSERLSKETGKIFVGKKFTVMSPLEAELTKYMHNVFGAYKITYFNACREYCEQMGGDWRKVHTGILLSGYINDVHTYVPGPDGKFGYGGKCFPKDVDAFAKMTKGTPLGTLLEHLHELNAHFRGVETE